MKAAKITWSRNNQQDLLRSITFNKNPLDFYLLQTVSQELEMILNSQELGVLNDSNVEQILTPNNLLFGRKLNVENVSHNFDTNKLTDLNKELKHINKSLNYFWDHWRSEYVPYLREY